MCLKNNKTETVFIKTDENNKVRIAGNVSLICKMLIPANL